jgi:hypothetical protein
MLRGRGDNKALCTFSNPGVIYTLKSHIPPGSLSKALYSRNPDWDIWFASYKEEYDGLCDNDTFDLISEKEYVHLSQQYGVKAIPFL